ncbi:hypothetical protein Tco_0296425 [Tanacetum coccineum]
MAKKVDDMTIAEYIEYEERMKRQYNKNLGSYFPTYSGHCTPSKNTTIKILRNAYFNPIRPNTEFNYDSEDMELDEEAWYTTDEESVMSEQEAINPAYAINTQSFEEELSFEEVLDKWEECRVIRKNRKISASEDDLKKSSQTKENTINNDNFTRNLPSQPSLEDLNLGSFLLPFTIASYNSYAMANIDASNNVLPRSIYEYLECFMMTEVVKIVECGPLATLTQVSAMVIKRFLEKANKECFDNGFDEYKQMFNNEVEHLSNEYILRIGKKGYVLYDVWEKCEQYHRKTIDSWHDKGFKEDKLWRSGDEKTDYEPPFVDVKNFEVKKYSFKGGKSFICITKQEDDALPLGCVNGARFKAMIRKELKYKGIAHDKTFHQLGRNFQERLDL